MKAPRHTFRLFGLALLPLGLAAQSAPVPSATATGATTQAPASVAAPARPAASGIPAAGSNTQTRISPEVQASLLDAIPQFDAPKPAPPPPAPAADDGPNNEIIRLAPVEVNADRPPIFKKEELYSKSDQAAIALRKYAGLNVTPWGFLNNLNAGIAMQMAQEDERLAKMKDLSDTAAAFSRAGDKEASDYLLKSSKATFMRTPDFGLAKKQ